MTVGEELNKTHYLQSAYVNTTQENVRMLIGYLERIGGKPLSMVCLRQNAFKITWSKRDVGLIHRCHIQNAAAYLSSISASYSDGQVKAVIADIAYYVGCLDSNEETSFIIVSTNTLPSAIHFEIAKGMFLTHQVKISNQNNYHSDLMAIYILRLSLESRVRGLLGIDYAMNKGKAIGLATLIGVAKNLKSISYSNDFSWIEIEWINNWLNHYMHRNIRPYPWVIYQAIETLQPFVSPKTPLLIGEKQIYSFYNAACVSDETQMENEILVALKSNYPDLQIKWYSKNREIVNLSK